MKNEIKKISYNDYNKLIQEMWHDGWRQTNNDTDQLTYNPTAFIKIYSKNDETRWFLLWNGVAGRHYVLELDGWDKEMADWVRDEWWNGSRTNKTWSQVF